MKFLKSYWQLILPIILIIVILTQFKSCNDKLQTIESLKKIGSTKVFVDKFDTTAITKWKDKYNIEHVKAAEIEVTAAAMKIFADSVANLLHIRTKEVTGMSKYIASINIVKPLKVDTFYTHDKNDTSIINTSLGFIWRDGNRMKVWGTLGEDGDTVHVQGIDTLSQTTYWQRKYKIFGLHFGAKQYYVDFSHTNPYIEGIGYKGIKQAAAKNNWSIGLQVGYGYQFGQISPQPYVGVGLSYNLIKF